MSYIRGVTEIVFARPLTMAEEWERDHAWTDWLGGKFSGRKEWDYVWNQPAVEKVLPSGAVFDQGHDGWRLEDFRLLLVEQVAAAGGGDELVPTLEEVAAARLYTGPAYVKLNGFMRMVRGCCHTFFTAHNACAIAQIGGVKERHWRARFAQLKHFTYSSTVYHLIGAIRKITQIAALQHSQGQIGGGGDTIVEHAALCVAESTELTTLTLKYLSNIVSHPTEPKYRTIKKANKSFSRVWSSLAFRSLLLAMGFQDSGEPRSIWSSPSHTALFVR
jgi:hypothetical protein